MLINQVPGDVPVNVLHDQGIPNTLSGMKLAPIGVVSSRQFMVWSLLLAILVVVVAVAVIVARASS
ncbi:MAG: hypothetical protein ACXWNI_02345 [Candidatus Limnocylindrales bacterium]